MKNINQPYWKLLAVVLLFSSFSINGIAQSAIPSLKKQGTAKQLIVDGKP